ncbi:putative RING finger protein P32A8.03c [Daldinia childiae]|uniref:putative RING finger protein P32A8.03c n=1 Tax=Daldinia childiae TaxID=326645 RepID=UPI001446EBAD|nr:putative RING finger protein P32A8.03c [Daldinia childiae]KAF3055645.1 putative RING finger protein P32A8.03c [Daldinia childiae]
MRRFTELISDIGGNPSIGRSGPDTLFGGSQAPRVTLQRFSGPGFTGGVSSVTFTSSSARARPDPSHGPGLGPEDPFQRVFGNIMGDLGPPPMGRDSPNGSNQTGREGNLRQPADFSLALSQLIASLINPHTAHGDAVYSQEALDRIITSLMEANPQSNAPAPASEEAIANLPKKKLDEEMLGPELKGECTICIDEVKVGDEAVVLPCKHWFHEQCAVLWLKQHNTCPICRASIDGEAAGRPVNAASDAQPGSSGTSSQHRRRDDAPPINETLTRPRHTLEQPRPGLEALPLPAVARRKAIGHVMEEVLSAAHFIGLEINSEETDASQYILARSFQPFGVFYCVRN